MARAISIPPAITEMLSRGGSMAVSISGGKDSQAMLYSIARLHREHGWTGEIFAVHAHLGRAEWPQTLEHCQRIANAAGVGLIVLRRPQGDLVEEIRTRMEALRGTGKPHWPDAGNRYCTSDQKRGQIDKVLRAPHWPSAANRYCTSHQKTNQIDKVLRSPWPTATQRYCTADQKRDQIVKAHRKYELVIAAQGMRAEESPRRAKMTAVTVAARVTAKALTELTSEQALDAKTDGQRLALDWLPLHEWTEADVWEACGTTLGDVNRRRELYKSGRHEEALHGFVGHPAYVFGSTRLSCALCVLASRNDLEVGAKHNPDLLREYVAMEHESGFTFRQDLCLETMAKPANRQQPALF
jgi:3'-phosphoadenosine 5'-phosphosulfate sulfotransferase (PAPS reductase)/FAD synthetase